MQNDPEQALDQLRNRYAVPDRIREYHFELRNRNFKSETDDALDFLTQLNILARLTILDDNGARIIGADERNRRVREQFIGGMPYRNSIILLREHENVYRLLFAEELKLTESKMTRR